MFSGGGWGQAGFSPATRPASTLLLRDGFRGFRGHNTYFGCAESATDRSACEERREESDNLPEPDVLAQEIVGDLDATLEQFREIANGLGGADTIWKELRHERQPSQV